MGAISNSLQLDSSETEEMQVTLEIDEAMALLTEAGFRKLTLDDKPEIRSTLLDYHLMVKVTMHMNQFAEGLKELKILDSICAQPLLLKPLFVVDTKKMSAGGYKDFIIIIIRVWFVLN